MIKAGQAGWVAEWHVMMTAVGEEGILKGQL
jgi:hypothetical protein